MFRLSLALGRTVSELEQTLGSGELTEWKAYYSIEPFGQERDNWNTAVIAATVANYSGKSRTTKNIDDCMFIHPQIKRDKETQKTLSMMKAMAKPNVKTTPKTGRNA